MASAEQLKITHGIDGKVMGIDDRVKGVEEKIQCARADVQDVGNKVQGVEGKVHDVHDDVQAIGVDVKDISSEVRGVDDKLDQVNRSLFLYHILTVPKTQKSSQGSSSEIACRDGFRPQIHPPIITSHAKLITATQLSGFSKAIYSTNGNPLTPSYGYTGNVRYSWPSSCDNF
jgi:uncharacterized protein YoxC